MSEQQPGPLGLPKPPRRPSADELATMQRMREESELAGRGLFRCRKCSRTRQLDQGLIVTYGGNVMFAICPECLPGTPLVIERRENAFYVGPLKQEDRRANLLLVKDMSVVDAFAGQAGLAKRRKMEL